MSTINWSKASRSAQEGVVALWSSIGDVLSGSVSAEESAGVGSAVEERDVTGEVAVGQHRGGEIGDLLGSSESADGDPGCGDAVLVFIDHLGVRDEGGSDRVHGDPIGRVVARQGTRPWRAALLAA